MKVQDLKPAIGSNKQKKRVGRGPGSGLGKTAGKGHKGQRARSGGSVNPGFEGGQMPLQRRIPKRGFTNMNSIEYAILNLKDLEGIGMDEVHPESLLEAGIIRSVKDGLKILGSGELTRAIKVQAHAFSKTAMEKIKAAGGSAEVI